MTLIQLRSSKILMISHDILWKTISMDKPAIVNWSWTQSCKIICVSCFPLFPKWLCAPGFMCYWLAYSWHRKQWESSAVSIWLNLRHVFLFICLIYFSLQMNRLTLVSLYSNQVKAVVTSATIIVLFFPK